MIAAPGRGARSISMRGTAGRNAEGQARDLEFLMAYAKQHHNVHPNLVALMNYSFGGLGSCAEIIRLFSATFAENKRIISAN